MGVCDGHGIYGHLVSNFVKMTLPKILSDIIQKQASPVEKGDILGTDGSFITGNRRNAKKGRTSLPRLVNKSKFNDSGLQDLDESAKETN